MPEVTKEQVLRVLARDGMGWTEWTPGGSIPDEPLFYFAAPGLFALPDNPPELFVRREARDPEHWKPDVGWRAAGELLEAVRKKRFDGSEVWYRFLDLIDNKFLCLSGLLYNLLPEHIAEAAYEALRG